MPEVSLVEWVAFLQHHRDAHVLQSGEWGELKSAFGWSTVRVISGGAGVQVLFRRVLPGVVAAYIPKPLMKADDGAEADALWTEIDELCRTRDSIFCKVEPDQWETPGDVLATRMRLGPSTGRVVVAHGNSIQPRRTIVVDLRPDEAAILERMKPKWRYNIRLAGKKGVRVDAWDDLAGFHSLMTRTAKRDGFAVHSEEYYRCAHELFRKTNSCQLLVATYEGDPLAALMVFARGRRAWYLYGGSSDRERQRMPNHLLQWEAMRWAKARGCEQYDLWGVPDVDEAALEANFERRRDGLWGVYRFKRGFGGRLFRSAPAVDRVYRPLMYRLYQLGLAARVPA